MKYYQLTHPDKRFAEGIAGRINKNYPGCAIVKNDCCHIKEGYWESCKAYVKSHCKIKRE